VIVHEYRTGNWIGLVTTDSVALLHPDLGLAAARDLWRLASGGSRLATWVEHLAERGIRTLPAFAMVEARPDGIGVLVRGDLTVECGDERLTGAGYATWREAVLSGDRFAITAGESPQPSGEAEAGGPDELWLPLGAGVALVSALRSATETGTADLRAGLKVAEPSGTGERDEDDLELTLMQAPALAAAIGGGSGGAEPSAAPERPDGADALEVTRAPDEEPAPVPADEQPDVDHAPGEGSDDAAQPGRATAVAEQTEPPAGPVLGSEPDTFPLPQGPVGENPAPEDATAEEDDHTILAPGGPGTGGSAGPAGNATTPGTNGAGSPAAEPETGIISEVPWARREDAAEPAAPNTQVPAAPGSVPTEGSATPVPGSAPTGQTPLPAWDDGDHDGETVLPGELAALRDQAAGQEHPAGTDGAEPPATDAGAPGLTTGRLELLMSNGERVVMSQPLLLGRAPESARFHGNEVPRLVTVTNPERDISATHVEVRPAGDHAVVTDMNSTNGTIVFLPGRPAFRLHPGSGVPVPPGGVIEIGTGVTVTVMAASEGGS